MKRIPRLRRPGLVLAGLLPLVAVAAAADLATGANTKSDTQDWVNTPLDANGRRPAPRKPIQTHQPTATCTSPALSKYTEQLAVPPQVDLAKRGNATTLTAVNGWHRFHSSLPPTPDLGYVPSAVYKSATTPARPGATAAAAAAANQGAATAGVDSASAGENTATARQIDGLAATDEKSVSDIVGSALWRQRDVGGGPTVVAQADTAAAMTVRNRMLTHPLAGNIDPTLHGAAGQGDQPDGVVHLHGAATPPAADGEPTARMPFGSQFTYRYPNAQEAAGFWYHDHSLGMTRLNAGSGLAGQFWLRDRYDTGLAGNPVGLPAGAYELPLTLQDRSFNADGTLCYNLGDYAADNPPQPDRPRTWTPEYFGDTAVVNGKVWPNLTVARGLYRFRALDASNARFYDLRLQSSNGTAPAWYRIGSDGGLFDAPVKLSHLVIAPGQRADLLIDFRNVPAGTKVTLRNSAVAPYPGDPGDATDLPEIMQFTVGSNTGFTGNVPANLRPGRPIAALKPTRKRTVVLNEVVDDRPEHLDSAAGSFLNNQHYTDNMCAPGDTHCVPHPRTTGVEDPSRNTVEEWVIVNTTADAHPIHLHMTQFQVLGRHDFDVQRYLDAWNVRDGLRPGLPSPDNAGQGRWPALDVTPYLDTTKAEEAPDATERGWIDTVIVPPGKVTRIVVPFGGKAAGIPAPFTGDPANSPSPSLVGDYIWHCHILEHEDNDMMQPLHVH